MAAGRGLPVSPGASLRPGEDAGVTGVPHVIEQHPDTLIVVHAFAPPPGGGGVFVDANSQGGVDKFQFMAIIRSLAR